ncbi:hypothetical protein BDU57DRAFT_306121 [Ampelomyces quisqualis]|uniref:Integral membrane protein n=1 Tax=Ampelomyces quisqualis TaxID=50730 RepID=A0A6A5QJ74_AMPQU|nr:hypothetical protein BDU57DRAFT_306121 [Ampelomyces quisqualis]
MHFTAILLFLAMTVAFAERSILIFDFNRVAACARTCSIILTSELNCVPPAAPVSNNATYLDCFCTSGYLKSLHRDGEICHQVCKHEDDIAIHEYYNSLCGVPDQAVSIIPSPTTMPAAAPKPPTATTTQEKTQPVSPPLSTTIPTQEKGEAKDHGAWLHDHWEYLVVAGVLIITLTILFSLAFLCHRRRQKTARERSKRMNRLIPLQHLSSSAHLSRPHTGASSVPLSAENLSGAVPASPLAPPSSPHDFGAALKRYAQEFRERDEAYARRAVLFPGSGRPSIKRGLRGTE